MLNSIDLNDRTYEEMLAEAVSQIPLYSEEWTNYNVSDPGITILQNLTAFNLLQQSTINEVTGEIRRKLLELVGVRAAGNRGARVLLKADSGRAVRLPSEKKLGVGALCFETTGPVQTEPWDIQAVFTGREGAYEEVTYLLERDVATAAHAFGPGGGPGSALVLVLDRLPREQQQLRFFVEVQNTHRRNPMGESPPDFAQVSWQFYTGQGWEELIAVDNTHGFLCSGEVRVRNPGEDAGILDGPLPGCAIRCVWVSGQYDIPPRLHAVTANLFQVEQRNTRVKSFTLAPGGRLNSEMIRYRNIAVYAREEVGQGYRAYQHSEGAARPGRFFSWSDHQDGSLTPVFDRERFGFGPVDEGDAVLVVCYDDEMVHHRRLGTVRGYLGQEIEVDLARNILPRGFAVLACETGRDGEDRYHLVRPDAAEPGALRYRVDEENGRLTVLEPGNMEGCSLLLCDLAETAGAQGNIRNGNRFLPRFPQYQGESFFNPAPGYGGTTWETVEQLRKRFVSDLKRPAAAVLDSDYEALVRETPGLCIHKVRAEMDEQSNVVRIAVKPHSEERLPGLSPVYAELIGRWLDERRMLSTKVVLMPPRYIPINVKATVYAKTYYQDVREEIESVLRELLNQVDNDRNFGGVVRFDDCLRALEALPGVESVHDLVLTPQTREGATVLGPDIVLAVNSLCYPGELAVEIGN